jgi:hypothetical protein
MPGSREGKVITMPLFDYLQLLFRMHEFFPGSILFYPLLLVILILQPYCGKGNTIIKVESQAYRQCRMSGKKPDTSKAKSQHFCWLFFL